MWIVGFAQDEQGRDIADLNPKSISTHQWRTEDSDGKQFKDFLTGEVGETITLTFIGESNIDQVLETDQTKIKAGKQNTTEACQKFAKFKLKTTAE